MIFSLSFFIFTISFIHFAFAHLHSTTQHKNFLKKLNNLSDYNYPKPSKDLITIAILNTNDIHGSAFKEENKLGAQTYSRAGLENLAPYINALKNEFKDSFLWLDSGDQFSGTLESKLTEGKIMTDFFNLMGLDAATIGNHEFDWEVDTFQKRLKQANFPYITCNIERKDGKPLELENTVKYKIFEKDGIKIGITGISTIFTPQTTAGDVSDYNFLEYKPLVIKYSKKMRDEGANIVILLAHAGINCKSKNQQDYQKLRITQASDNNDECYGNEILDLINELPKDTIDAVYAGHVHKSAHSFVKGVPILQNSFHALTFNIGYFTFDKNTKNLIKEKTVIEGPVPVCSRIFSKSQNCKFIHGNSEKIFQENGQLTEFEFHGTIIKPVSKVMDMLNSYRKLVNKAKMKVVMTTDVLMKKEVNKNSPLANFACDMVKNITKSDFCIMNQGMFRASWQPGDISFYKYYEMFSLSNNIVTTKVSGSQLKRIMKILNCGRKAFYATSGLTSYVVNKPKKCLIKVTKSNGDKIDNDLEYTIVSNDYFLKGGDDFKEVLKEFKVKIKKNYGEFKDITMDWLKKYPLITNEMVMHMNNPSLKFIAKSKN